MIKLEQDKLSPKEGKQTDIQVRVVDGEELATKIDEIAHKIVEVASDGFGPGKIMSPERIKRRLSKEPFVVLAEQGDNLIGFQFQSIHDTNTQRYLYYSRVVRRDQQGRGIAKQLLDGAIDHYQPSVIGARSQNPAEILSFIKAMRKRGITSVFPFVDDQERQALQTVVTEFLEQIDLAGKVNPETGLVKHSYEEGKLGDYAIQLENPEILTLEKHLQSIGLKREEGDSVFYFARLREAKSI